MCKVSTQNSKYKIFNTLMAMICIDCYPGTGISTVLNSNCFTERDTTTTEEVIFQRSSWKNALLPIKKRKI